ncbi:hypothetical protein LEP1GSC019_1478 [Leptospira interrogans serovar Pyrogenes str. 2006006960]|nr:hypothetical protein LEP1GSC019_1478 [Leptospira interrogans serovar Pyrogenes str. 2006006960]
MGVPLAKIFRNWNILFRLASSRVPSHNQPHKLNRILESK